jgi:hypothetical protein
VIRSAVIIARVELSGDEGCVRREEVRVVGSVVGGCEVMRMCRALEWAAWVRARVMSSEAVVEVMRRGIDVGGRSFGVLYRREGRRKEIGGDIHGIAGGQIDCWRQVTTWMQIAMEVCVTCAAR